MPKAYTADRRLYLTADQKEVVEEGDEKAAYLLVGANQTLPYATAVQYGLVEAEDGALVPAPGTYPSTGNAILDDLLKMPDSDLLTIAKEKGVDITDNTLSREAMIDQILGASGYDFDHTGAKVQPPAKPGKTKAADTTPSDPNAKPDTAADPNKAIQSPPETQVVTPETPGVETK